MPAPHELPDPQTRAPADVVAALATDAAHGLTAADAAARLEDVGPNRLREEKRAPAWRIFLGQFQDFMIYVLLAAVAIAAFQGDTIEAVAILAILLLNGVLGFLQESRAQEALAALAKLSAPLATVVRDGIEADIAADGLVPGDVVLLEAGDAVPADGRLLEAASLKVVESMLTGESEAAEKDAAALSAADAPVAEQPGMVFAGTAVAVGRARFAVTATGQATQMGRIASLLAETPETDTPLQVELDRVGKRIALLVLAIAAIVFAEEALVAFRILHESGLAAALADPAFQRSLTAGLLVAVSLAVAAIPEGLPAIVTVALSLGVRRMAERNAIVRRLHAVETLGSTSFICTDKTGTLTRNEMAVLRLVVGLDAAKVSAAGTLEPLGRSPLEPDLELLLTMAAANNDARIGADGVLLGDPTETALLVAADALAPHRDRPPRVAEIPFDSLRKRMTTIHERADGSRVAFVKGGADVLLPRCAQLLDRGIVEPLTPELLARVVALNTSLAEQGFRTLAFALRELPASTGDPAAASELAGASASNADALESALTYVGLLGLVDPPRAEVPAAIAECRSAGIQVAMITGDHALTAEAIAREIGLLDAEGGSDASGPTPGSAPAPGGPSAAPTASRVVTGAQLERLSAAQLDELVASARVYARVDPEHKLRIVEALKRRGEIVAMTGDGVNDAPALKRADIGVAMGRVGTDVARDASDLVLADDDFATIVHAVELGRVVYDNLLKVILFLISCNASEVLVVFTTALVSPATALLPLQLLWINLITDGLPALALGVDPSEPGVMARPPRDTRESILSARQQLQIGWQGLVMTAGCLGLYYGVAPLLPGTSADAARTMLFSALVLMQLLHAFDFRSSTATVWHRRSLENRWLVASLGGSMLLQAGIIYVRPLANIFHTAPLSAVQWIVVVAVALLVVLVIDTTKLATARATVRSRS